MCLYKIAISIQIVLLDIITLSYCDSISIRPIIKLESFTLNVLKNIVFEHGS